MKKRMIGDQKIGMTGHRHMVSFSRKSDSKNLRSLSLDVNTHSMYFSFSFPICQNIGLFRSIKSFYKKQLETKRFSFLPTQKNARKLQMRMTLNLNSCVCLYVLDQEPEYSELAEHALIVCSDCIRVKK